MNPSQLALPALLKRVRAGCSHFMLAILIIVLAIAAPRSRQSSPRPRDRDHAAWQQYIRAVQLYTGNSPVSAQRRRSVKPQRHSLPAQEDIDPTTARRSGGPSSLARSNQTRASSVSVGDDRIGTCGDAGASNIGAPVGSSSVRSTSTGFGASAAIRHSHQRLRSYPNRHGQ